MTHSDLEAPKRKLWCIVVADDHGPEYVPTIEGPAKSSPVQYCGFGEPTTLLQKALHRAKQIAPTAQIAVTVREEDRERWEPALWFIRPECRFVSDARLSASLTIAAALSSIAADSVSNVVTILPARCYVAHEWVLSAALDRLHETLPGIPEGVGTLGMIDIDDGLDEDYLPARLLRMCPSTGPVLRKRSSRSYGQERAAKMQYVRICAARCRESCCGRSGGGLPCFPSGPFESIAVASGVCTQRAPSQESVPHVPLQSIRCRSARRNLSCSLGKPHKR